MFQPGEEGFAGARVMIEEGLLDRPVPNARSGAFALHISTDTRPSTINLRPGPMMAAADFVNIDVRGRGGHASQPSAALDPITVAAEIVLGLQAFVTRRIDVFDPAVVTIARIPSGTTNNIIPESACLEGTMRTFSETTRNAGARGDRPPGRRGHRRGPRRDRRGRAARRSTRSRSTTRRSRSWSERPPVELFGEDRVDGSIAPVMGAEDFSYVLQQVPGAMAFLGGRPPDEDPATAPANHSNHVVFDEPAMATGVATYAAVALRSLDATSSS